MAAVLRKDCLNKKFIAQAHALLKAQGNLDLDHADFKEFLLPVHDGDVEENAIDWISLGRVALHLHCCP
ncbi:MAG: hypothetical protein H7222_17480 [Methylotenera sp.]|nr:hypothetical protein [Oligoflexia bacterium]